VVTNRRTDERTSRHWGSLAGGEGKVGEGREDRGAEMCVGMVHWLYVDGGQKSVFPPAVRYRRRRYKLRATTVNPPSPSAFKLIPHIIISQLS